MSEATGFLDRIRRTLGDGVQGGDEHGGAAGRSGQGLPTGGPGEFMFATGIECSYPRIAGGTRRDLLAECGHYDRWREDLALTHGLGLRVLRYGLPYYSMLDRGSREDLRPLARQVQVPVLVVAGADDAALGPVVQARETLPMLPGGELRTVADSQHLLPLDQPDALVAAMLDWAAARCGVQLHGTQMR